MQRVYLERSRALAQTTLGIAMAELDELEAQQPEETLSDEEPMAAVAGPSRLSITEGTEENTPLDPDIEEVEKVRILPAALYFTTDPHPHPHPATPNSPPSPCLAQSPSSARTSF